MNIPFNNSYVKLPERFYARVHPATVPAPSLIKANERLAKTLSIDANWLQSKEGVSMLAGNKLPDNADPIAMVYAAHQFGGWVPQLGDGRAILLGEVIGTDGVRYDIQLKGSGITPFSRQGDGKAAIGPVLREYIVSEAMHVLGVPTTRSLAAVLTGETVMRDQILHGAILTRVAQSHVRVGTFQYFYARDDIDAVKILSDYVIERHYPEAGESTDPYLTLLGFVAQKQANLIAHWMSLGFIHGVMNTDNMQIAGETIDYGPCAYMDVFHPEKVFSSIDRYGRYAWNQQPAIGQWNLTRLAETLLPLIDQDQQLAMKKAESVLNKFSAQFNQHFLERFSAKLGLPKSKEHNAAFIQQTFTFMTQQQLDFTLFFRELTRYAAGDSDNKLKLLIGHSGQANSWLESWETITDYDHGIKEERLQQMHEHNPVFIPRNHRIEVAIEQAESGKFELFHTLTEVLSSPYENQSDFMEYEQPPTPQEEVRATFCGT